MQDPELYLKARNVDIPALDEPKKPALLLPDYRAYVNWEIFFFRSHRAAERFRKDPLKKCGVLTDPVNGARFKPTKRSPHTFFSDRHYYFSADSTFVRFQAMPDSFAVRRGM